MQTIPNPLEKAQDMVRKYQLLNDSLFNRSLLPKWICDRNTLAYLEVNDRAIEHYGFSREEFLKMSPFDIRHPEDREELTQFIQDQSCLTSRNNLVKHIKRNGEVIYTEVEAHVIPYKDAEAVLVIALDITHKLSLERQLMQERLNKQREINRVTIETQEKERAFIGKELHDNVNQMLATTKLYLEHISDHSAQKPLLLKATHILNASIEEIRKLSHRLVPPSLGDVSLEATLSEMVDSMKLLKKYRIYKEMLGLQEALLSNELKLTVFRILQEQLSNVLKYAEATEIHIGLKQDPKSLWLTVKDNGKGFEPAGLKKRGIGITNITNRAQAYGGKVRIESAPGNGCSLSVHFILEQEDPTIAPADKPTNFVLNSAS